MARKRKENEAGSSNDLRADGLHVLGVFKVATANYHRWYSGKLAG
ncbi:hypothetical protein [Streptomyces sp. AS58]|nr:hypothetical protein [Streptomyces sp. AS58]